jgi:two-component system nitrate/nitrite response regulator NarL
MPAMTATVTTEPAPAPAPPGGEPLRVLIADDHPLFRRGVARAVARHPGLTLVGEAQDGREAIELIDLLEPDVAVLDQRMPHATGTEVVAALHARPEPPATALLLLSAFEDVELVAGAVRAGAAGYVGKTASQGEICDAILAAGDGGLVFADETLPAVNRLLAER